MPYGLLNLALLPEPSTYPLSPELPAIIDWVYVSP